MGHSSSTVVNTTPKKLCILTFNEGDRELRKYSKMYVLQPDTQMVVEAYGWAYLQVCVVSSAKEEGNILLFQRWKCRHNSVLTITKVMGSNVHATSSAVTKKLGRGSISILDEIMFNKAQEALFRIVPPATQRMHSTIDLRSVKMLLVGDCGVGKTWLLTRLLAQRTHMDADPSAHSVGNDYKEIVRNVCKTRALLQIWDTSGQERFRSATTQSYAGSEAVMVVFDVTDRRTFASSRYWLDQTQMFASSNAIRVLIGNKSDCALRDRQISYEDGVSLAAEYGIKYLETSAKANINVNRAFDGLAEMVLTSPSSIAVQQSISGVESNQFFKVLMLGNSTVGKTSIKDRYTRESFCCDTETTTEAAYYLKNATIGRTNIKAQIWDIGGSVEKKPSSFYRGAAGAIVMFDVTQADSFASLGRWISELRSHCDAAVPIVIVGNKCDKQSRVVSSGIAMDYALANGALYMETSAATGLRVEDLFHNLFEEMLEVAKEIDEESQQSVPISRKSFGSDSSGVYFTAPTLLPYMCGYHKSGSVVRNRFSRARSVRSSRSDARSDYSDEGMLRYDSM